MERRSVLVVDDSRDIREELGSLLEDEGYEVLTAQHGLEALELLKRRRTVDLIVLDLMMPVMDGVAFRQAQLRDPELASIPFVLLTGSVDARFRASSLGALACLQKPFEPRSLLEAVRMVAH